MGSRVESAAVTGVGIGLLLLFLLIFTLFTTLIVYAAWNLAVVAILGLAPIDWPTAFGIALIINVIRSLF